MSRALVLQHVPHEGPGRLRAALEAEGVSVEVCRLDQGGTLPTSLDGIELLVVMGGPMGVGELADPRFPFLRAEVELIRAALTAEVGVLGICLGAQLLAHTLGARVYPNQLGAPAVRIREVGWGALMFHHDQDRRGLLRGLHDAEVMLHWHGDTFDLPAESEWLASTLHCPHQLFRHKRSVGLQFHPELDERDIEALLSHDAEYVRETLGDAGQARLRQDTKRFMARYREVSERLLQNVVRTLL